jgi:hypothetical protein
MKMLKLKKIGIVGAGTMGGGMDSPEDSPGGL